MVKKSKKERMGLEEIEKLWESIKPFLTKEALERLSNLKVAHTEKWLNAVIIIYQYIQRMLMAGKEVKIDERTLKNLLENLFKEEKRRPKIRFIH
ncbi:MAG: hypothetical protein BXU00_03130 [Candidatus Nanoclepta minutus]|uniref:Uncharacterized protein n=1 Tax=Candidatus Nanoclepta minutus TaxID=1940235 RepID=A0A397WM43_9ARCH|nr:MAG: hypothetical protein BXU00_03130 [Candidatus Nanoclepta minutus]